MLGIRAPRTVRPSGQCRSYARSDAGSAHKKSAISGKAPSNHHMPSFFLRPTARLQQDRRLAGREDPEYSYDLSGHSYLQPHALPQPRILFGLLRLSQEQASESPRVCCEPSKCDPKRFPRKCGLKVPSHGTSSLHGRPQVELVSNAWPAN
jgi:hypothetical protein